MIRHGAPPYLECSTKGDKRFSAFCARLCCRGNRTIEEIYQSAKEFAPSAGVTHWRQAKGLPAINQAEVSALYLRLWVEYIKENPHLLEVLAAATGLSDIFGQAGHCCQATALWRIRRVHLSKRGALQ
jgi:hypothetical protein